jgi:thioredoxin 2
MVSPALEQLAKEKAGQLKLVKVDIDRAPRLARRFSIQAVPTLMVLDRGEVIARQPGRREGSMRPTEQDIPLSKDVWLATIGASLVIDDLLGGGRRS